LQEVIFKRLRARIDATDLRIYPEQSRRRVTNR
jgi:hypothetical protein